MYSRVGAPQAGRLGERDVRSRCGAIAAQVVAAPEAAQAGAARRASSRPRRGRRRRRPSAAPRASPISSIMPSGSWPGMHGHRRSGSSALELLVVAAADAARLDAQERAVVVDLGDRQVARLELARRGLHHGEAAALGHGESPRQAASQRVRDAGRERDSMRAPRRQRASVGHGPPIPWAGPRPGGLILDARLAEYALGALSARGRLAARVHKSGTREPWCPAGQPIDSPDLSHRGPSRRR